MQNDLAEAKAEAAQSQKEVVAKLEEERDIALARASEAQEALQSEQAKSAQALKDAEEQLRRVQEDAASRIKSLKDVSLFQITIFSSWRLYTQLLMNLILTIIHCELLNSAYSIQL